MVATVNETWKSPVSKAYIIATEAIKDPSGMAEYAKAAEPADSDMACAALTSQGL